MIVKRAQIIGVSLYAFRPGEPAFIIGAAMVTPEGLPERLCYHVIFDDGKTDFIPVSSVADGAYRVVAEECEK
jgi:hypothetical protein